MKTDTPETDSSAFEAYDSMGVVVPVAVCRSLERERNQLREAIRVFRDANGRYNTQIAATRMMELIKEKPMNGKGDTSRPVDFRRYGENYDRIFRKPKTAARCEICGLPIHSPTWRCTNHRCRIDNPGVI